VQKAWKNHIIRELSYGYFNGRAQANALIDSQSGAISGISPRKRPCVEFGTRQCFTARFSASSPGLLIRPRSRFNTFGGTSPVTSPPKLKTSFSIREQINDTSAVALALETE
jgi:hypothetical protein